MKIDLVSKQDVARISEIYLDLYHHVYKRPDAKRKKEKLIAYVEERLKKKDYFIYKTVERNRIIGTISFKILSSKRGYITDAYVEPDSRRKGIVRRLEKKATTELMKRDISIVELDVRSDNEEGTSTWSALGYEIKKTTAVKNAHKQLMMKKLNT